MRIKYSLINKLNTLKSTEFTLFLYLAKYQQLNGLVQGVHNQMVCQETGMCKQSFYNALRGLEKKNIISVTKASDIDYNVLIIGNDFTAEEAFDKGCEGYINLHRAIFHKKQFKQLGAKEKWLVLYFLHCTHENRGSYRIGTHKFYEKFCAILKVTKRMVREYLHKLRSFFSIGIKNGLYYITYKRSVFEPMQDEGVEKQEHEHFIRAMIRRCKIKKADERGVRDVAQLIKQYRNIAKDLGYNIFGVLQQCISSSIECARPKDREINARYIHKLVRQKLALEQ